jgi:hypothetical protein
MVSGCKHVRFGSETLHKIDYLVHVLHFLQQQKKRYFAYNLLCVSFKIVGDNHNCFGEPGFCIPLLWIHTFLGLPDPDPSLFCTDLDPSINKQKK